MIQHKSQKMAGVKKGRGLEDVVLDRFIQRVAKVKEMAESLHDTDLFREMLTSYRHFVDNHEIDNRGYRRFVSHMDSPDSELKRYFSGKILTPVEINAFLNLTAILPVSKCNSDHYAFLTGEALGYLIRNSYEAGYRDFILSPVRPIDCIGRNLKATKRQQATITVYGDVKGSHLGAGARHVKCEIFGDVDGGHAAFWKCKNSTFIFDGRIFDFIALEFGIGAEYCNFLTSQRDTLKRLLSEKGSVSVPGRDYKGLQSTNKVGFIDKDGTVNYAK